jgi:alkylated DNA repair dioxygenase AlkB
MAEEQDLLRSIEDAPWSTELQRRVQHYGYAYNYKSRAISARDKVADIPAWVRSIGYRLVDCDYFSHLPDQVIVNEYEPGQGIGSHIDRETCFGPEVASLSLGSAAVMQFVGPNREEASVLLPRCSLIVLQSDARYHWKHAIPFRRLDRLSGVNLKRGRRISLTFRTVILDDDARKRPDLITPAR